jgi:hypothetical protein
MPLLCQRCNELSEIKQCEQRSHSGLDATIEIVSILEIENFSHALKEKRMRKTISL